MTSAGDPSNPDKPGTNDPTGVAPTERTYTHTMGIKLFKVAAGTTNPLTGAQFRLSGTRVQSVLVNGTVFKASDSGSWWRLKDGTYTEVVPTTENVNSYEMGALRRGELPGSSMRVRRTQCRAGATLVPARFRTTRRSFLHVQHAPLTLLALSYVLSRSDAPLCDRYPRRHHGGGH